MAQLPTVSNPTRPQWHIRPLTHLLHSACGMISPKNSTAVTDTMMAVTGSASLSRKMGSACGRGACVL